MEIEAIKNALNKQLSNKRYLHSIGVQQTAIKFASIYGASIEKASMAGLVHDCGKELSVDEMMEHVHKYHLPLDPVTKHQNQLLHGMVGAEIARNEFGIEDSEILNAVRFHTTGKEGMTLLEKIIYLADLIEPNRNFQGIEILREMALSDLDKATLMAFDHTIKYVISKGQLLHPNTIHARNDLVFHDRI